MRRPTHKQAHSGAAAARSRHSPARATAGNGAPTTTAPLALDRSDALAAHHAPKRVATLPHVSAALSPCRFSRWLAPDGVSDRRTARTALVCVATLSCSAIGFLAISRLREISEPSRAPRSSSDGPPKQTAPPQQHPIDRIYVKSREHFLWHFPSRRPLARRFSDTDVCRRRTAAAASVHIRTSIAHHPPHQIAHTTYFAHNLPRPPSTHANTHTFIHTHLHSQKHSHIPHRTSFLFESDSPHR